MEAPTLVVLVRSYVRAHGSVSRAAVAERTSDEIDALHRAAKADAEFFTVERRQSASGDLHRFDHEGLFARAWLDGCRTVQERAASGAPSEELALLLARLIAEGSGLYGRWRNRGDQDAYAGICAGAERLVEILEVSDPTAEAAELLQLAESLVGQTSSFSAGHPVRMSSAVLLGLVALATSPPATVVLSYSHADRTMMEEVRAVLEEAGLAVWTDADLVPGTDSWNRGVEGAIQAADAVLALLTPTMKASFATDKELGYAQLHSIPIIAVLADGDRASSTPLLLVNAPAVDVTEDRSKLQLVVEQVKKIAISGSKRPR